MQKTSDADDVLKTGNFYLCTQGAGGDLVALMWGLPYTSREEAEKEAKANAEEGSEYDGFVGVLEVVKLFHKAKMASRVAARYLAGR
jgi:hypothetical protein